VVSTPRTVGLCGGKGESEARRNIYISPSENIFRSRALLAGYVQALQVRYQGAPKAGPNYVEIVGLQKLQIQSASLVAIGANPLDFFLAASPSSHHPHRPPGSGQFMGSFPPNVFLFTGHFFPENLVRPSTDPPLKNSDTQCDGVKG
jgi:hypothetical protein